MLYTYFMCALFKCIITAAVLNAPINGDERNIAALIKTDYSQRYGMFIINLKRCSNISHYSMRSPLFMEYTTFGSIYGPEIT